MTPPTAPEPGQIAIPAGVVAITTYGAIQPETVQSFMALRGHADRIGLTNVDYQIVSGQLVDKARNEAGRVLLAKPEAGYLLFIDADMVFQPDLLEVLLRTAYADPATQSADLVGAYCQLRGSPYMPTIDTGTGTWEAQDARQGPLDVIRTGGACLLVKRHVFERMEFPWFGVRPAPRPIDMLTEVDNYARIKFDGRNPFWGEAWEQLLQCAREDAASQRARGPQPPGAELNSVGEDSNFADKAKALGFRIVVQTDAVVHHLERRPITPEMHVEALADVYARQALLCGVGA